jgi:hypothetical protein
MKAVAAALVILGSVGPAIPHRADAFEALCDSKVACWAVTPAESQVAVCGEAVTFALVKKLAPKDLKKAAALTRKGELYCASVLTFYVDALFASLPKAPGGPALSADPARAP